MLGRYKMVPNAHTQENDERYSKIHQARYYGTGRNDHTRKINFRYKVSIANEARTRFA